jgi:predicted metallopeptidase
MSASFDYTAAIRKVCEDVCFRVPELRHIDMSQVAVSFTQTKDSEPFGVYASTTPLRFQNGEREMVRRGRTWTIQRCVRAGGGEYLYLLYFYVPRFMELPLLRKIETIVHELYHIGPLFDGDFRRFPGRCYAHGSSQKKYDQTVARITQYWLKQNPPEHIWRFLTLGYSDLTAQYGKISGTRIPKPRIIPLQPNHQLTVTR